MNPVRYTWPNDEDIDGVSKDFAYFVPIWTTEQTFQATTGSSWRQVGLLGEVQRVEYPCLAGLAIDKLGHYEDICADPDWLRDLMKLWRQLCKISCNECQHMQDKTCPCPPPWGGHIRYNCPEFMKLKENY